MVAKRMLDFGTPRRVRRRQAPVVLYRSIRPEIKYKQFNLTYSTVASTTQFLSSIGQGSGVDERIGAKVKIYKVEYILAQTSGDPIRVDISINNVADATPAHTFSQAANRTTQTMLSTKFLHSGANLNSRGGMVVVKMPYPVMSKYTGSGSDTVSSGQVIAHITTPTTTTITGYFRVYYTDV